MIATYRFARTKYQQRQAEKAKTNPIDASKDNAPPSNGNTQVLGASVENNNPIPSEKKKKCQQCVEEKSAARKYRWKILFCLLPAFFDASLDLTIVATALPQIASHFDRFNQLNWIVTAFTLTSTAFIPVFGSLADTFGRYASIQTSIILLLFGSVLCAAAPNWATMLLGRALQGTGTAGVQNVAMIILADKVSLREQAVNTSIFQLMNGVGYSVGPVIGGYLTNSNWRYCFVLSAGLSVMSVCTIFFIRNDLVPGTIPVWHPNPGQSRLGAVKEGVASLDFGGITLFIFAVGLIILGTAWGGSTYAWSSPAVIVPLAMGGVLLICFIVWESQLAPGRFLNRKFPRTTPMIPSSILNAKDVKLVCFISCGTGAALYSVFYFIGIYFTLVEGYPASKAGTQLLFYTPGLGVGVYATMFFCNVWPRQTFWPLSVGTAVETIGIAMLSYAVKQRNATFVNVMMAIAGAGTGMRFMPSNLHLAGMFRDRLAPAYSLLRFALPFGGTLALTVMGSVFQNRMADVFGASGVAGSVDLRNESSLNGIAQLPAAEQQAIRAQGATATMWSFISIVPLIALTLVASLGLGNVWISKKNSTSAEKGDEAALAAGDPQHREDGRCARHARGVETETESESTQTGVDILEGSFVLAMLRGNVKTLKKKGPQAAKVGRASHDLPTKTISSDASIPITQAGEATDGVAPVSEKNAVR